MRITNIYELVLLRSFILVHGPFVLAFLSVIIASSLSWLAYASPVNN